jgi:Concanavalin A-like lectin/glucanases superfamily
MNTIPSIGLAILASGSAALAQAPPCGASLRLDGTNFVSAASRPDLQNADRVTYECWFRGNAPRARILSKGDGGSCLTNRTVDFSYEPNKSVSCWFFMIQGAKRVCVAMSGPVVPLNTWAHVAATFDTTKRVAKFFVNGKLVSSKTTPKGTKLFQSSTPFYIGATPPYQYLTGDIKQVRVWKVAQPQGLIQALRFVELSSFPNLVASWPLSGHLFDIAGDHHARPAGRSSIRYTGGCGTRSRFGTGTKGPFGVPSWGADRRPVFGQTVTFTADNPSKVSAIGLAVIGMAPAQTPLLGGTLLVKPALVLGMSIPAAGLRWPVAIPKHRQAWGTPVFTQLVVGYPSRTGLGFSAGLQLMVGDR